uniref:Uncharacterized protein n=1 Tax=Triticum urartu TaxID=4572 RepID=A0A8R7UAG9_TRIUA
MVGVTHNSDELISGETNGRPAVAACMRRRGRRPDARRPLSASPPNPAATSSLRPPHLRASLGRRRPKLSRLPSRSAKITGGRTPRAELQSSTAAGRKKKKGSYICLSLVVNTLPWNRRSAYPCIM